MRKLFGGDSPLCLLQQVYVPLLMLLTWTSAAIACLFCLLQQALTPIGYGEPQLWYIHGTEFVPATAGSLAALTNCC